MQDCIGSVHRRGGRKGMESPFCQPRSQGTLGTQAESRDVHRCSGAGNQAAVCHPLCEECSSLFSTWRCLGSHQKHSTWWLPPWKVLHWLRPPGPQPWQSLGLIIAFALLVWTMSTSVSDWKSKWKRPAPFRLAHGAAVIPPQAPCYSGHDKVRTLPFSTCSHQPNY